MRLSVTRGVSRGGVVLVVEVEERGTVVINELFPSTSAATAFWGGADVSETNLLGHGINLGAGFVASTTPVVPNAHSGLGLRLRAVVPPIGGPYGLSLSATGLYNDGSEFQRVMGAADDPDPRNFIGARASSARAACWASGKDFRSGLHATLLVREEVISAQLPIVVLAAARRLHGHTTGSAARQRHRRPRHRHALRSDPAAIGDAHRADGWKLATSLLGSSYDFAKTVAEASFYRPLPRGHALGFHVFAGAIAGDAPFFDRFFVGDLNLLLPRRALGINFSTQPSRNLLDTRIAHHRYDNYAGRVLVEYAVPIWRRRGFVYGGDAFVAAGLFGMASNGDAVAPAARSRGTRCRSI